MLFRIIHQSAPKGVLNKTWGILNKNYKTRKRKWVQFHHKSFDLKNCIFATTQCGNLSFFLSLKFFPREVFGKGVLDLGFISTNIVSNWQSLILLLENLVAEKSFYFRTVILCLYWIDVVKQSMLHQTTQFISKLTVKLLGKMHLLFAKAKLTHKWKST